MNKSKKKHFNFLSKRQNRYSIRRFSAGIASVLVGTAFFLGAHTSDASAAEQDTVSRATQTSQDASNTSDPSIETTGKTTQGPTTEAKPSVDEVNHKDTVAKAQTVDGPQMTEQSNEATTTEIPTKETDYASKAPVKEETQDTQATDVQKNEDQNVEQAVTPKNSTETSHEEKTTEETTIEDVKTEEAVNLKDTAKTEKQPKEEITKRKEVPEKEKGTTEKQTTESSSSEKSTTEFPTNQQESPSTEIPTDQTQINTKPQQTTEKPQLTDQQLEKLLKETNFDNMDPATKALYLEHLKEYADKQDAQKTAATVSTRNKSEKVATPKKTTWPSDVVSEDEAEIPADAIANGYIKSGTDATNAAHTLSGRAWLLDHGTPATMANGLTPVPDGTKVHLQWMDKDGATSPIYTAKTTNRLSSVGGSQVGPGAYAFDLRQGWTDANGKHHVYSAVKGQRYKIWIDDFTTKDGNVATMLRVAGGYLPGTYVDSVTYNNMGQFPLIGTNMQRTGIFMTTIPSQKYLTSKHHVNDSKGAAANPAVTMIEDNFISGKVWVETGDGDYANSATGPNYNMKDMAAAGYKVVMTSLTDQGAKAYDAQVNRLPEKDRAEAARKLLKAHPEYMSVTVEGTTNGRGEYTLRFPKGALNKDHLYGYVMNRDGEIVKTYSGFTSAEFRRPNYNLSVAPQTAPYYRPIRHAWVNVNFAVVETTQTQINITNFDVTSNPAHRGQTAYVDIKGMPKTSLQTRVQWKDSSGRIVKDSGPVTSEKAAENKAKFMIPTNAKSGEVYTVQLVVGGHVTATDSLIVHVNEDAAKYQPVYPPTTVEPGQKVTIPAPKNANGRRLPNGTTFTKGHHVPQWVTVNHDGSITVKPGEKVAEGDYGIPVIVTYSDGSKNTIFAPVTVQAKEPMASQYEPTSEGVTKKYGESTTADDVLDTVEVPDYPMIGEQPVATVDDETQLPDGTAEGQTDVDVTVTYPDGTTDHIKVPVVTEKQPDGDKYEPTSGGVTKPFGTPVTSGDVTDSIQIPNFPAEGEQPVATVDDETQLPDGTTEGQTDVDVTVTYPDGTKDHIKVPVVTQKQPDGDKYEPTSGGVTKPFGTPVTSGDVTGSIQVPNYPVEGQQPVATVDDESQLPDGTTEGHTDVDVTVTYPDGTTDHIKVPVVTQKQPDGDKYEPTSGGVTKPFGTPVTSADVTDSIQVPNFPAEGEQPVATVDDESQLPDGTTEGQTDVDVTVTYPDGTTDHIKVPVVTQKQPDGDKYEPTSGGVTKPFGTPVTSGDVTGSIQVPNYPTEGKQPVATVDDETQLPDGTTEGQTDVDVTVTYPDGTTDHIKVPVVTEKQPDGDKYEPTSGGVTKPFGTPVTSGDVTDSIQVPNFPAEGEQPVATVDDETQLPDGTTEGQTDVDVTVTYPDGTKDHIKVPVVTEKQLDSDKYDPVATGILKQFGDPTTEEDVTKLVEVPDYPTDLPLPKVTVTDPSTLPDGQTPGKADVDVTVTYPDGSTDHISVPVWTNKHLDKDKYEPTSGGVTKPFGTPVTSGDVTGSIQVPNYPTEGKQPVATVDDETQLPDGTTEGQTDVDVTVTYPDGTTDHIKVPVVTEKQPDGDKYEPTSGGVTKPFGTPVTSGDVTDSIQIPNFPAEGEQPVATVDDETQLPDGTTEGQTDVDVTVTYPDGSKDHIQVPVVTNPPADNVRYEPTTDGITKPFGEPTTADDVTGAVKVPNFPTDGKQPVVTVIDPRQLPNGKKEGQMNVGVTVTYPDDTTDYFTVPVVTNKQPDSDKYAPTTEGITKPYGIPTTASEVLDAVNIPNYPVDVEKPVLTVKDPTQLPDGKVGATVDVDVRVTYPDGTTDEISVPVTTSSPDDEDGGHGSSGSSSGVSEPGANGPTVSPSIKLPSLQGFLPHFASAAENHQQSESDKYTPTSEGVTKAHGIPVTTTDVTDSVKIPNYPTDGEQPVVTVNDESQLPDGTTDGTVDVGVEVTYPDGSTTQLTVPVTVGSQPTIQVESADPSGVTSTVTTFGTVDTQAEAPSSKKDETQAVDEAPTVTTVAKGHKTSVPVTKGHESVSDKVITMPTVAHESQQTSHAVETVAHESQQTSHAVETVAHVSTTMTSVENGEQEASGIATTPYAETNQPAATSAQATDKQEVKQLPETGEDNKQAGILFGGLIAVIGSLLLFGRRRNSKKD